MPPKPAAAPAGGAAEETKYVYLKVVGGEVTANAVLAPKIGSFGIPPKKVGEDIQKATTEWRGIKVKVELAIVARNVTVNFIPTSSALLIKALGEPPRDRKKVKNVKHNGDIPFTKIIEIAKTIHGNSLAKEFKGTVKQVIGTCVSIGCTIDKMTPKDVHEKIDREELDVPASA